MFVVVIFHLFYVCKICVVFVVKLNVKVIPVKYGREHTHIHYKLESNIFTKQLHVPTTKFL